MFRIAFSVALASATVAFVCDTAGAESTTPSSDLQHELAREFTLEVLPLIRSKCAGCHGNDADDLKGELSVMTRADLITGGESGEASIVPGKSDESSFYEAVAWEGLEMPPKENDRLTEEQVELVRRWIDGGAPWPSEADQAMFLKEAREVPKTEDGWIVSTSGGTSDEWTYRRYKDEDLWAFRPVQPKSVTAQGMADDVNPVDHFVHRELEASGVEPAAPADPEVVIRRATYDLTGLPPTPEEIEAFVVQHNADAETAWDRLVDRLLDSPRYGERWAQHWLDVTRYADTGGMSNDYERSNMWRYRDYVIRAFNQDKPYNEFIVEQLAGDELADESVRKRNADAVLETQLSGDYTPQEAEWLVATGFLRLGAWDNAMTETAEARQIYLDDVVNVVGQTFLSTTMRCFKCHDHKFDPLPTRDYYRMYSAFSTTRMAERKVPILASENREGFEEGETHVRRMLKFATDEKDKLIAKREAAAKAWFDENGLEYKDDKARKDLPDEKKPPRHVGLDHTEQGQLKVREQDVWIWTRRLERYQPMAQSVYNAGNSELAWNGARKLRIDKKADRTKPPETHILMGGGLTALGDPVGPGVLSATGLAVDSKSDTPYRLTDDVEGRRLGLAKWIADPANPLTARSIVNRIWQGHFGRGIAANPNNFGGKGAKPTHSELLDFLAADLVENGWKIKRLHRMLMKSKVYRQSSTHADQAELVVQDPDNLLLAYFPMRRLTAEEFRDSMLSATGELNDTMGGVPVMPEINMEVALQPRMIQFSLAPAYQPSPTPDQRNRRTVYAYRVRGQADPFLELFNQPNPNESCELRDAASVTPQAFTLLNSDVVTDRSIAMALRLQAEASTHSDEVTRAFQVLLGRDPNEKEHSRLTDYVSDMVAYHRDVKVEPVTYPGTITRSLVEEFSGKPFEYMEILPVFEDYTPDQKPSDVTPTTRAIADLCVLLINSNEFAYVR